jgi:hypothetical protein
MGQLDPRLNQHLMTTDRERQLDEIDELVRAYEQELKSNQNPKHIQQMKEGKTPFEAVPLRTLEGLARVMKHGADKYGKYNWREQEILASTYKAAIMRHLIAWSEDEWKDPDSGEQHLHHIMACCCVALDAAMHGTMVNDLVDQETK